MPILDEQMLPLLVAQAAGILIVLSTMLLLAFRRIYIDAETKQPIEFQLPLFGKLKTQTPVIAVILVGAVLVLVPLAKLGTRLATLKGEVHAGNKSVRIIVVPIPHYQEMVDRPGLFEHTLPLIDNESYRVKFFIDNVLVDDQLATLKGKILQLKPMTWAEPQNSGDPNMRPIAVKEVSDEALHSLGIVVP